MFYIQSPVLSSHLKKKKKLFWDRVFLLWHSMQVGRNENRTKLNVEEGGDHNNVFDSFVILAESPPAHATNKGYRTFVC